MQRKFSSDEYAAVRSATGDGQLTSEALGAFPHSADTVADDVVRRCLFARHSFRGGAAPVVPDAEKQAIADGRDLELDGRGVRMSNHIGHGFLDDQIRRLPDLCRNPVNPGPDVDIQAAASDTFDQFG